MNFSLLERLLWITISASELALLCILIRKRFWLRFPVFSAYVGYTVLRELVLFLASRSSADRYFYTYYGLSLLGTALMLLVIIEIGVTTFRPIEVIPRASLKFGILSCLALLVATCLWCWQMPLSIARNLPGITLRLNLLMTCLRFAMFAFLAAFSGVVGLNWRHYVFGIAAGIGIYSCVDLVTTMLRALFNFANSYGFDEIGRGSYLLAVIAWCFVLRQIEPARIAVTPEVRTLLREMKSKLESYQHALGAHK
jgi:hypothetical protein